MNCSQIAEPKADTSNEIKNSVTREPLSVLPLIFVEQKYLISKISLLKKYSIVVIEKFF